MLQIGTPSPETVWNRKNGGLRPPRVANSDADRIQQDENLSAGKNICALLSMSPERKDRSKDILAAAAAAAASRPTSPDSRTREPDSMTRENQGLTRGSPSPSRLVPMDGGRNMAASSLSDAYGKSSRGEDMELSEVNRVRLDILRKRQDEDRDFALAARKAEQATVTAHMVVSRMITIILILFRLEKRET